MKSSNDIAERLRMKRKHKKRIMFSKIYKKKKSFRRRDGGKIKPVVKVCSKCRKRVVKNHHFLCNVCYNQKEVENGFR